VSRLAERMEWYESLTRREREIFTLIATGYDNAQIAERLGLAEHTVRNHVSAIYSKLGVDDRFQIIQLANKIRYSGGGACWTFVPGGRRETVILVSCPVTPAGPECAP